MDFAKRPTIFIDAEAPASLADGELPDWRRKTARFLKNVMYNSILDAVNLVFTFCVVFFKGNVLLDEIDVITGFGLAL